MPCVTTHLLDTNAWLRTLGRSFEFNDATRALIFDSSNAPFALSAMSVWEVCTKFRKRPNPVRPHVAKFCPAVDIIALRTFR